MIKVKVDRSEPVHLHDQVAAAVRRAIAEGEAGPGERLPPAHHLAAVMGVNTNTVLRALRSLRDEGLLEMRPRRGTRVVGSPQDSDIRRKVSELAHLARHYGYTRAELASMVMDVP